MGKFVVGGVYKWGADLYEQEQRNNHQKEIKRLFVNEEDMEKDIHTLCEFLQEYRDKLRNEVRVRSGQCAIYKLKPLKK